ncbi:MAG: M23 family metallopeptidase [Thermotogae bacterium]|nr:M23 family metallopeptidase [Thermotogota bacterium]
MKGEKIIFKRFGKSYIVVSTGTLKWLGMLVMLLSFVWVGGVTYSVSVKRKFDSILKERDKLYAQNDTLKRTLKLIDGRLQELAKKQKSLATYVGIYVPEKVSIGGNLRNVQIDTLEAKIRTLDSLLDVVNRKLHEESERYRHTPSIPPVRGMVVSGYGVRRDPITGGLKFHEGLDYAAPEGTPVVATADGIVEKAGNNGWGYGIQVIINHGNGVKTRYAHLEEALVKVGDTVKRGQVIGLVGTTGRSVGEHLHYEVIVRGTPVNPMRYILVR